MDDHKSLFARGTDAVKDAGKHLADQYKSAMDKVTGAEMTRNMESTERNGGCIFCNCDAPHHLRGDR